jgi:succinate dehydrogenase / fumarate reductase iron-sulfur subunit
MRVMLKIQRFNPEADVKPHDREYFIEAGKEMTVLSGLMKIKTEVDGSLTFRASCRMAICGSCNMMINGTQRLACKTSVRDELERRGELVIRPMANMRVIKDLAVDMDPFWGKVRAVTPWVASDRKENILITQAEMEAFHNADGCIMCGACLSACMSADVSPGFLGPAALAKAYRFVADPRDETKYERLASLQHADGIWDCVRCNFCVEVCPKDVQPMEQIVRLRRHSLEAGFGDSVEARHITAFVDLVREEGRLNEARQPLMMVRSDWRRFLKIIPLGLKMFLHGKIPFPFKKIKGVGQIRAIFESLSKNAERKEASR